MALSIAWEKSEAIFQVATVCLDVPSLIPGEFPDVRLGTNRQGHCILSWDYHLLPGSLCWRSGSRCAHRVPRGHKRARTTPLVSRLAGM